MLEKKLEDQERVLDYLQEENVALRTRVQTLEDKIVDAVSDLEEIKKTMSSIARVS